MKWTVGLAIFLGVCITPYLTRTIVEETVENSFGEQNRRLESHYAQILSDLKIVAQAPPFPKFSFERNAGPLLADHAQDYNKIKDSTEKYPQWKTDSESREKFFSEPEVKALDTTWLAKLMEFDHWDLTADANYNHRLAEAENQSGLKQIGIFSSLPIPEYKPYTDLALIYAYRNPTADGLKVYHKLAELSFTSSTLVGQMIAVHMLDREAKLADEFGVKSYEAPSREAIAALKRVSWAWNGLAKATWYRDFPEEFKPYLKPEFGMCAGAWESSTDYALGLFLEGRPFPFEADFSKNAERSRRFSEEQFETCHLQAHRVFLTTQRQDDHVPWRLPYVGQVMRAHLMAVAVPNYVALYENNPTVSRKAAGVPADGRDEAH